MPPSFACERKVASAGVNSITIAAPIKPNYIYAIEAVNLSGVDRVSVYIAASKQSTDQICILIPETDTSSDGTNYDAAVWSGKIPFEFPMVAVFTFKNSALNDTLWAKLFMVEK